MIFVTPSPLPETSLLNAPAIVIAALSGRALAAAARRAGYRVLVADLFRDLDTQRLASRSLQVAGDLNRGLSEDALDAAFKTLLARETRKPVGWTYGSGLEDRPGLIARLEKQIPVLGNGAAQVAVVKDPVRYFALLDDLSIPHPEVSLVPPRDTKGWLVKRGAASGGAHIKIARTGDGLAEGCYFQRRAGGRAVSALFLANGARAVTLGFSEQWPSPAGRRTPFRFGGAAQPAALTDAVREAMTGAVQEVSAAVGLRGLNSADFLARDGDFDLLEINPRPGASLDIHDLNRDAPLFELHRRAVEGELPAVWSHPAQASACTVVYARRGIVVPSAFRWPRWCADRPPPLTRIGRGEPVCTILARGKSATDARRTVMSRGMDILALLESKRRSGAEKTAKAMALQVGP